MKTLSGIRFRISRRHHKAAALRGRVGFTLIELLVVLSIIALLLTIAVPRYYQHVERTKEAVLREDLATMRDALDQYHADTGHWPDSLETLVTRRYMRTVPVDPITQSADTWVAVPPSDGSGGVYDVHSGAEGSGNAEEQPYAAW